jgi:hypothetical protein
LDVCPTERFRRVPGQGGYRPCRADEGGR